MLIKHDGKKQDDFIYLMYYEIYEKNYMKSKRLFHVLQSEVLLSLF